VISFRHQYFVSENINCYSVLLFLPVLFTQGGRFDIVNQEYRESLADKNSDDYKQLAAEIKNEVGK